MRTISSFFRKYCGSQTAESEHAGSTPSSPKLSKIHPVSSETQVCNVHRDDQPRRVYEPQGRAYQTTDPNEQKGILGQGLTYIVEPRPAPGGSIADAPSDGDQDSKDRFSGDFRTVIELIEQRSDELNRDHTRGPSGRLSFAPAVEDGRGSSSRNLSGGKFEEALQVLTVDNNSRSTTDWQRSSMQGQSILSIAMQRESPPGPPPPCSHCNNEHHAGYCRTSKRFSSEELKGVTDFSHDSWFDPNNDYSRLHVGKFDGRPVIVAREETGKTSNFFSEIDILRYLRHPNIVTLRGYCDEDNNQALVFDFVCNKTLSFHLSAGNWAKPMPWEYRANLAIELTKGLIFLHDSNIIHGNISTMNVFVTHDFVPVIGEFSVSRSTEGGDAITQDRSGDKIARGYLPPDYVVGTKLSEKVDVYAFGVILFELVTGRRAFDRSNKISKFLGEWGRETVNGFPVDDPSALLEAMADPRLKETEFNEWDMLRMLKVATICTSTDPDQRPLMPVVLDLLTGEIDIDRHQAAARSSRESRPGDNGEIVVQAQTEKGVKAVVVQASEELLDDVRESSANAHVQACAQLCKAGDEEASSSAWRRLRMLFGSNLTAKSSSGGGRTPLLSPGPWYGRHDFKRPSTPGHHYMKAHKPWRGEGLAPSPRRSTRLTIYIKRYIPLTGPRSGSNKADGQKHRVTFAVMKPCAPLKPTKKRVK